MAQLLGVSVSTIRRRMLSFNISIRATYSFISDTDLDGTSFRRAATVSKLGEQADVWLSFFTNIRVQYSHVRELQSRVDPDGSMMRQLLTLRRRSYSVRGP